jgi:hypothetical protein
MSAMQHLGIQNCSNGLNFFSDLERTNRKRDSQLQLKSSVYLEIRSPKAKFVGNSFFNELSQLLQSYEGLRNLCIEFPFELYDEIGVDLIAKGEHSRKYAWRLNELLATRLHSIQSAHLSCGRQKDAHWDDLLWLVDNCLSVTAAVLPCLTIVNAIYNHQFTFGDECAVEWLAVSRIVRPWILPLTGA